MDENDMMEANLTDLDLNQEPYPPVRRTERYFNLNDLESAHTRIEERIRQLEAVTARARQRQRQSRNSHSGMIVDEVERGALDASLNVGLAERGGSDRGKGCKRDSSHLVAKALGIGSELRKSGEEEDSSFYDCNICLDLAREPVLTCCGHLFCWPCFYQVSKVDSTAKECPVCKGEVSDSTVIPIYGKGSHECVTETESGFKIPPRPKAPRVESIRQQRVAQGHSHVPVAEALRRIRISIGAINNQTQVQEGGIGVQNSEADQNPVSSAVLGPRVRINQVSRVLSESAASLSSLSSALTDAERLVEDLETAINNRVLQNRGRAAEILDPSNFTNRLSISLQPHDSNNGALPMPIPIPIPNTTSSQSADGSGSILGNVDGDLPIAPPSYAALRRRFSMSRGFDRDNQDIRESRRRRLN